MHDLLIDLTRDPADRWSALAARADAVRELVAMYLAELRAVVRLPDEAIDLIRAVTPEVFRQELAGLERATGVALDDLLVANVYYDLFKAMVGCTAFAVDTPHGPLHARNLDWWTTNDALARHTQVARFTGGARGPFRVIGWPGYIGALSACAPGRFAITMNAVLSGDPISLHLPIACLIRSVCETAAGYRDAVDQLAATPIACDCLLLVTGTAAGEMTVIERSPTRHARRQADAGAIVVTNDYHLLPHRSGGVAPGTLAATSCGRFQRATDLLAQRRARTADEGAAVLADPGLTMEITVQRMVLSAAQGLCRVEPVRHGRVG